ncbi:hypothetical protein F4779DRAFT_642298 [Xylariaceae sp. FL0662B]|nr:hypothetical protein F4779DRAFT_642298 [Xylariaceae sp. FL0662B]
MDLGLLNADANVELELSSLVNVGDLDPMFDFNSSNAAPSQNSPSPSKPYHPKRPHKKSRSGCKQCKRRKVKCDEARPACKACTLRKQTCIYPINASVSVKANAADSRDLAVTSSSSSLQPEATVVPQPLFRPGAAADIIDMKMLWFYTTYTFCYFSVDSTRSPAIDHALQVKVVEYAFQSPFLMDCLMGLSALHLQSLNQPIPPQRALTYRAKAFEGYRDAIERAKPADFPALIACSLLMAALSSQTFREPDGGFLYIIDWMQIWRGISLIFDIVSPQRLQESGLAMLFYRPPVDLEKSVSYIPNHLLFMIASIGPNDSDYEHQQTYYDTLKYLGSLYVEMKEHGFSPIMDLRIITFFTFIPRPFIPLARELRPRALVILAHFLCFVKLVNPAIWWMRGIADREIPQICQEVGDEWAHLLRVPRMVLQAKDKLDIAKLIIDSFSWSVSELNPYDNYRDSRPRTALKLIDNQGAEVEVYKGQWRYKETGVLRDPNNANTDSRIVYPLVDAGDASSSSKSTATTPSSASSTLASTSP